MKNKLNVNKTAVSHMLVGFLKDYKLWNWKSICVISENNNSSASNYVIDSTTELIRKIKDITGNHNCMLASLEDVYLYTPIDIK